MKFLDLKRVLALFDNVVVGFIQKCRSGKLRSGELCERAEEEPTYKDPSKTQENGYQNVENEPAHLQIQNESHVDNRSIL